MEGSKNGNTGKRSGKDWSGTGLVQGPPGLGLDLELHPSQGLLLGLGLCPGLVLDLDLGSSLGLEKGLCLGLVVGPDFSLELVLELGPGLGPDLF